MGRAGRWPGGVARAARGDGLELAPADADGRGAPAPSSCCPCCTGRIGEDGTVQGLLELIDVPYVGSGVLASAVGMDKALAKELLADHGVPQGLRQPARATRLSNRLEAIATELGLPVFVKPANMGSSVGVTKAHSLAELQDSVDTALTYDEWVVIEEAIVGREIEVAVLGNLEPEASVPGEIIPGHEFYDYEDKYVDDGAEP